MDIGVRKAISFDGTWAAVQSIKRRSLFGDLQVFGMAKGSGESFSWEVSKCPLSGVAYGMPQIMVSLKVSK